MRDRDFSRDGVLSPELLVTLLLFMAGDGRRRGYRHLLDAFWDQANQAGIPLPTESPVSAPASCQARSKLSAKFIRTLLHKVDSKFDATFEEDARWNGRRVLSVDGTGINLQRSNELLRAFRKLDDAYCPQAQVTTLFNVVSKVPIDVAIAPYKTSERALLLDEHLPLLAPRDVLVLDRGYPGFEVFERLLQAGVDLVVRVPSSSTFRAITDFLESGSQDRIIEIEPGRKSSSSALPLRLRAVRSKRPDGRDVVLVTSLKKSDGYSGAQIAELYQMRWEVEEHYKCHKSAYMGQEQLHSRTTEGVRQELLAVPLFHSLSHYFLAAAARHAQAPYKELSTKSACLGLADYIVRLFADHNLESTDWLRRMLVRIARTPDKKRPGRKCPRRSFKPRPRWGPAGRLRA